MIRNFKLWILLSLTYTLLCGSALAHPSHQGRVESLSNKLKKEPNNVMYLLLRGDVYIEEGAWDHAEQDFLLAEKLEPDTGRSDFHLAKLAHAMGNSLVALDYLSKALEKNDSLVAAKLFRVDVLTSQERYADAIEQVSQIINSTANPLPDLYVRRDNLHQLSKSVSPKARRTHLLDGINKLGPLVVLVERLVSLDERGKDYKAALASLELLSAKLKNHPKWMAKKIFLLKQDGRTQDANSIQMELDARLLAMPSSRRNSARMKKILEESQQK